MHQIALMGSKFGPDLELTLWIMREPQRTVLEVLGVV